MKSTQFTGKTALITGGSRGIGAAIAKRLSSDGAQVAITYNSSAKQANELTDALAADGARCEAIRADAAQRGSGAAAVQQVIDEFGRLDILIINAGVMVVGAPSEIDDDAYDKSFDTNVRSAFEIMRAADQVLPDGGRVIVIGSVSSQTAMFPGMSLYAATKSAIAGLVRGWARDLGGRGITVNGIQPGPIDTAMNPADSPHAKLLCGISALGRYGKPQEVAALAAFLAGSEAGYITGATINIDGGLTA